MQVRDSRGVQTSGGYFRTMGLLSLFPMALNKSDRGARGLIGPHRDGDRCVRRSRNERNVLADWSDGEGAAAGTIESRRVIEASLRGLPTAAERGKVPIAGPETRASTSGPLTDTTSEICRKRAASVS